MKICLKNGAFWDEKKTLKIKNIVNSLHKSYEDEKGINHISGINLPSKCEIYQIINDMEDIIFPGFANESVVDVENINYFAGNIISKLYLELCSQISRAFRYLCTQKTDCENCDVESKTIKTVSNILSKLSEIRDKMKKDIIAAYEGDPAAKSLEEIIISYPGLYAIMVYRIAHEFWLEQVPLIPRIMSEYAHGKVGIDIHPGAHIGSSFFIDHGTGVVIGETAIIGNNVTLYQGVTLGALSFPKTPEGNIIRDRKRHPTLEDDVTVYAGATILGDVVIGKGSVIGGNVWLTEGVAPYSVVTISKVDLTIRKKK